MNNSRWKMEWLDEIDRKLIGLRMDTKDERYHILTEILDTLENYAEVIPNDTYYKFTPDPIPTIKREDSLIIY